MAKRNSRKSKKDNRPIPCYPALRTAYDKIMSIEKNGKDGLLDKYLFSASWLPLHEEPLEGGFVEPSERRELRIPVRIGDNMWETIENAAHARKDADDDVSHTKKTRVVLVGLQRYIFAMRTIEGVKLTKDELAATGYAHLASRPDAELDTTKFPRNKPPRRWDHLDHAAALMGLSLHEERKHAAKLLFRKQMGAIPEDQRRSVEIMRRLLKEVIDDKSDPQCQRFAASMIISRAKAGGLSRDEALIEPNLPDAEQPWRDQLSKRCLEYVAGRVTENLHPLLLGKTLPEL